MLELQTHKFQGKAKREDLFWLSDCMFSRCNSQQLIEHWSIQPRTLCEADYLIHELIGLDPDVQEMIVVTEYQESGGCFDINKPHLHCLVRRNRCDGYSEVERYYNGTYQPSAFLATDVEDSEVLFRKTKYLTKLLKTFKYLEVVHLLRDTPVFIEPKSLESSSAFEPVSLAQDTEQEGLDKTIEILVFRLAVRLLNSLPMGVLQPLVYLVLNSEIFEDSG